MSRRVAVALPLLVVAGLGAASCAVTHHGTPGAGATSAEHASDTTVGRASPPPPPRRTRAYRPDHLGPNAVSFVSASRGWALSQGDCGRCGTLRTTTDAGRHWAQVTVLRRLPGTDEALRSGLIGMYFADDRHGYLYANRSCSSRCLLETSDGGRTWSPASLPAVTWLGSSDDGGRNGPRTVYVRTAPGPHRAEMMLRTSPGSGVWTRLGLPAHGPDTLVAAEGTTIAYLVTDDRTVASRLWVSTDGGAVWTPRPVPCPPTPTGAPGALALALDHPSALLLDCFDSRQSSQALRTRHHIYGSADGGRSWARLADAPPTGDPALLVDNGAGHAFLAVESGGADLLDSTLDHGLRWRTAVSDDDAFFGWANLRFLSARVGFVFGPTHYAREHVYRTLDAGRTWHRLPLPST